MRSFALSCTHRPAPASPRGALGYLLIALASACELAVPAAHAADDAASSGPITANSSRWRVDMEASKERLVDADSVKSGGVIEYRELHTSASKTAKSGITATGDVQSGQRSILNYLIKPVSRAFSGAMTQR